MINARSLVTILGTIIVAWFCWRTYNYFFDAIPPQLHVVGVEQGGCYAGDIQCGLSGTKVANVSVWLDGKPVVQDFKIHTPGFENALPIPTKSMPNGLHHLKIQAVDGSYNKNKACYECDFEIDNTPLQAAIIGVGTDNKVFQGRTLHVQVQANKPLAKTCARTLAKEYGFVPESQGSKVYEAFIPIECDESATEYSLSLEVVDAVGNAMQLDDKFQVMPFPFKKTNLTVSAEKVNEEKEIGVPQQSFEDAMTEITQNSIPEKMWRGSFFIPLDYVRTTCDYGTMRTTQEKGRYSHKALDIIGPYKCVVWAPHDGIVALKDRYVFTGNTVVLDHGCGLTTMLCHLDSFADISVGDKVKRGNPMGIMGKTGYSKGDHLHWEMRLNNVPVDPMQWTKSNF